MTTQEATATETRDFTVSGSVGKRAEGHAEPRRTSPQWAAFEAKKSAVEGRIQGLRAQIEAVRNGFAAEPLANLGDEGRRKRAALIEQARAARAEQKAAEDERRALHAQATEVLEALRKKGADAAATRERTPFRTPAEIDARVAQLERTLDSGRFTLSEERQMLGEASRLRKLRRALESADAAASNDAAGLRARLEQLRARQATCDVTVAAKRDAAAALAAQIDALSGVQAADRARAADRRTELDGLYRELEAEKQRLSAAFSEYREQRAAAHTAYLRGQARREELQRQAQLEEQIDALERQLGRTALDSPIERKYSECTSLINFFAPLAAPASASASASTATTPKTSLAVDSARIRRPQAINLAAVHVLNRPGPEESYFTPAKPSKASRRAAPAPAAAAPEAHDLARIPFHVLAALADMALPIPRSLDDLTALLATLHARRADLHAHHEASLADAQAAQDRILAQIAALRDQINDKALQITPSLIRKTQKEQEHEQDQEHEHEHEQSEEPQEQEDNIRDTKPDNPAHPAASIEASA